MDHKLMRFRLRSFTQFSSTFEVHRTVTIDIRHIAGMENERTNRTLQNRNGPGIS